MSPSIGNAPQPESETQKHSVSPEARQKIFARKSTLSFVFMLSFLLLVIFILLFSSLPQLFQQTPAQPDNLLDDDTPVIAASSHGALPQIPGNQSILYEQEQGLYLLPATGGNATLLSTPGYIYSSSVPPVLLPSGQLLYSSATGIQLTDIYHAMSRQLAPIASGEVLTSLVANDDGSLLAWSTAPSEGVGTVKIYSGSLKQFSQVYEQPSATCPCLRVFSFLHATASSSTPTLLLTDDRGDHEPVAYGAWLLPLNTLASARPVPLLPGSPAQGPLALAPTSNTLLYTHVKGFVPAPTDGSVPIDIATQTYANALSLIPLDAQAGSTGTEQELVPMQRKLSNSAAYHWITTPSFAPDGRTLLYVLFSSDATQPYARHNALYEVKFSGASGQLAAKPDLFATSMADFIELGPWLNTRLLTLYGDGSIYILDTESNGLAKVGSTNAPYARIIAVVKSVGK